MPHIAMDYDKYPPTPRPTPHEAEQKISHMEKVSEATFCINDSSLHFQPPPAPSLTQSGPRSERHVHRHRQSAHWQP